MPDRMPEGPRERLHRWFIVHAGVVSLETMLGFGFSRRTVYRMVERELLIILQPGVFQSTQYPTTDLQRQIAMCMRTPTGGIGYLAAARLWAFRKLPKDRHLYMVVHHGSSPLLNGAIVRRSLNMDPNDFVQRTDGIRLTSPARTLIDIADAVGDIVATSILEQLINDGRGTLATHASTLLRLGHGQRPGTSAMARVIAARPVWSQAMQSDLEVRVMDEIHRQGLPAPVTQHSIEIADGQRIRFDFAWPDHRVGLEIDHPFWHAGEEQSHGDKWRDRKAAVLGWATNRITSLDVEGGLRDAITDIAAILAMKEGAVARSAPSGGL